jgi:hypothetical protein
VRIPEPEVRLARSPGSACDDGHVSARQYGARTRAQPLVGNRPAVHSNVALGRASSLGQSAVLCSHPVEAPALLGVVVQVAPIDVRHRADRFSHATDATGIPRA